VVDTGRKARVKISYLGDNFTGWFLGEDGKVEAPIGEQELRFARLKKASVDEPILVELGGKEKAETTLTEMHSLMEKTEEWRDRRSLEQRLRQYFLHQGQKRRASRGVRPLGRRRLVRPCPLRRGSGRVA